ncbi:MAG TPA: SLC13 family permease, partial [Actinotalea sp.]|nr:SLC13 family permease [Actinotalea sp.]
LSLLVLAVTVALFIWNRLPVGVVAILTALTLYATGLVGLETALGGFGDPVVLFIASLFVVSEGLDSSGVTAWAGQVLTERAGTRRVPLMAATMGLAALLSAAITPNGAIAALLPVTVAAARRARIAPSVMLIPLAFAASAGALLTLSGSPVNVIVSEASVDAGGDGFGFFEFAAVGLPLVLGVVAISVLAAPRLLPHRTSTSIPADFSDHLETLLEHYSLDHGFFRLRVTARTPSHATAGALDGTGLTVIGVQDRLGHPATLDRPLEPDDVLVVSGELDRVLALTAEQHLVVDRTPLTHETREALLDAEVGIAELVVPPRSALIGRTVFPGLLRSGVVVLAVRRLGRDRGHRPTELVEGDALLVHGTWPAVEALALDEDVLLVGAPDQLRRQVAPLGAPAARATAVLAAMIVLLATGAVAPAVAGLLAATAMVLLKVVSVPQAYRAVSWQTVVLIGGLIPLSTAIRTSGAADLIAEQIVAVVGTSSPYLLLVALFVLTAALGQVVSNTATVLIVVPIALAAATETGISPTPVLMLVAVAGAASLLTPIATPANMMVMAPGGYRFSDYWRLGLAAMALWLVVGVLLVPVVWPF